MPLANASFPASSRGRLPSRQEKGMLIQKGVVQDVEGWVVLPDPGLKIEPNGLVGEEKGVGKGVGTKYNSCGS